MNFANYERVHAAFASLDHKNDISIDFIDADDKVQGYILLHLQKWLHTLKRQQCSLQTPLDTITMASPMNIQRMTINGMHIHQFLLAMITSTGAWYLNLWIMDCTRLGHKVGIMDRDQCLELFQSLANIVDWDSLEVIPRLKVVASLLRLGTHLQARITPAVLFQAMDLFTTPEVQRVVNQYASNSTSKERHTRDRRCSLGLVALDPCPFAVHFLMRLFIYASSQGDELLTSLLSDKCLSTSDCPSLFIHGLFSQHEGLLYKFLILSLSNAYRLTVDPTLLYEDLLWKCDYEAEAIVAALESADHGMRMLLYFKRLYQTHQIKSTDFHRNQLLPALRTRPHLKVIVKYLELQLQL